MVEKETRKNMRRAIAVKGAMQAEALTEYRGLAGDQTDLTKGYPLNSKKLSALICCDYYMLLDLECVYDTNKLKNHPQGTAKYG